MATGERRQKTVLEIGAAPLAMAATRSISVLEGEEFMRRPQVGGEYSLAFSSHQVQPKRRRHIKRRRTGAASSMSSIENSKMPATPCCDQPISMPQDNEILVISVPRVPVIGDDATQKRLNKSTLIAIHESINAPLDEKDDHRYHSRLDSNLCPTPSDCLRGDSTGRGGSIMDVDSTNAIYSIRKRKATSFSFNSRKHKSSAPPIRKRQRSEKSCTSAPDLSNCLDLSRTPSFKDSSDNDLPYWWDSASYSLSNEDQKTFAQMARQWNTIGSQAKERKGRRSRAIRVEQMLQAAYMECCTKYIPDSRTWTKTKMEVIG